jgi:low temperature requirement protein LtrA
MRVANEPASQSAPGTHRPPQRPLFEPPRIRRPDEGERPTSWLEFFFDLVFVVAIDQLARRLQHGVTGHGTIVYFALYGPVWWAWVGFVLYTDRFGTDDVSDRFLTLLQIGAVLVVAAAASEATSDRAAAFAVAYGTFRLILAVRYATAAYYVHEARRECARQAAGFALAALIWIASAAVPSPLKFWMWGAGFAVDLLTPFASPRMHQIVPPDAAHIEERFGTFINISLGEGFVGLVEAMRDDRWSGMVFATAALSLLIGFSIWWGFFDNLDQAPIKEVRTSRRTRPYKIWVFSQLPLAAGVAAVGIAVGNLVHDANTGALDDSERWLACGMVALCYVAHTIVHVAYAQAGAGRTARLVAARKLPTIAAALLLGALGGGLSAVEVAGILAVVSGAQMLWNMWDRAHTDVRSGEDPGPGLAGVQRPA